MEVKIDGQQAISDLLDEIANMKREQVMLAIQLRAALRELEGPNKDTET